MDHKNNFSFSKPRTTYRKINTKEFCFFCLKPALIKSEESDERSGSETSNNFSPNLSIRPVLLCLRRHLKINLKKATGNFTFGPELLQNEEEEVEVNLCSDCEKSVDRFSTLYLQLETIQMEMDYQLKRIHHCISEGAQNSELLQNYSKKMTSDPETLTELAWIDKLRKEFSRKRSKHETEWIPTVELRRVKFNDIPQTFPVKQEPNDDFAEDVAMFPPSDFLEVNISTETADTIPAQKLDKNKKKGRKLPTSKTFTRDPLTGRFHCPSCPKTFAQTKCAKVHFDSVHLKKRWTCDSCNTVFAIYNNLLRHKKRCREILLKRTKEAASREKFRFPCPTCNKRFPGKVNLQHHMKMFHSKSKFSCDCCGKTFKSLYCLKDHKDHVKFGKTWRCKHCNKEFPTRVHRSFHQSYCSEKCSVKIKKEHDP